MASTKELTDGKQKFLDSLSREGIQPAQLPDVSEGEESHKPSGTTVYHAPRAAAHIAGAAAIAAPAVLVGAFVGTFLTPPAGVLAGALTAGLEEYAFRKFGSSAIIAGLGCLKMGVAHTAIAAGKGIAAAATAKTVYDEPTIKPLAGASVRQAMQATAA